MLEEFLLLLESEKDKIKTVLKPHIDEKIFKRLLGGFFDDAAKRFVAFAFMPISESMFYEYDYLFNLSTGGHTAVYFLSETTEKTRKYLDQNSFQYKSVKELIEEHIYKSLLITYIAEFDFGEWNILRDCCFSDIKDKNKILSSKLPKAKISLKGHFLEDDIFEEASAHHIKLMDHIRSEHQHLPVAIPVEMRPFIGHSNLVAMVRAEKKVEINLSFQDYIKKTIYQPLIVSLKTQHPEEYQEIWGFYGTHCNFLIPSHRQFCLLIFVATDTRKKRSLQFYFYHLQENKLYSWTYFKLNPYKEKVSYNHDFIVKILSPISQLDSIDYIIEPKSNFDDDEFWNNFVLKKDKNGYLYLTETTVSKVF